MKQLSLGNPNPKASPISHAAGWLVTLGLPAFALGSLLYLAILVLLGLR